MGRSIHQRKECLMKNMEFVGFDDLNGKPGFQMAMQKANGHYYLYATSFRWSGINILDVTDPTNPKKLNGWKDSGLMTVSMTDKVRPKFRLQMVLWFWHMVGLWMFYMEHRKEIPYRIGVEFLSGM